MPRLPQCPRAVSELTLLDLSHIGSIKNICSHLPVQTEKGCFLNWCLTKYKEHDCWLSFTLVRNVFLLHFHNICWKSLCKFNLDWWTLDIVVWPKKTQLKINLLEFLKFILFQYLSVSDSPLEFAYFSSEFKQNSLWDLMTFLTHDKTQKKKKKEDRRRSQ